MRKRVDVNVRIYSRFYSQVTIYRVLQFRKGEQTDKKSAYPDPVVCCKVGKLVRIIRDKARSA